MQTARAILWQIWRIIRWPIAAIVLAFVGLFLVNLVRYPQMSRDAVAQIHAQKLTMADVDGSNLPPVPNQSLVDATVEGIDANKNGIRDDVELAIFAKYPSDIKTRAAALQYSKSIQNYLALVLDTETLTAAAQQEERAASCIAETYNPDPETSAYSEVQKMKNEVKTLAINTDERREKANDDTRLIRSFGSLEGPYCDVAF